MNQESKGKMLLIVAMLIFGFLGVVAKSLTFSPLLLLYAMQVAGLISFFFVALKKGRFSYGKMLKFIPIMVFFALLSDFTFFSAVKLTSIANAVFIKFTAPIFIVIFVPLLLYEKREKRSAYAIFMALLGLFLILYQNNLVVDTNMFGMLFAFMTAIALAMHVILVKKITGGLNVYTMLFYRYLVSTAVLTPLVFIETPVISSNMIMQLALFGFLFAVVGTSVHMEGIKRVKAQYAGILGYIEPLSATLYGILLLSEIPTPFTLLGGALVLLSTYLVIRKCL